MSHQSFLGMQWKLAAIFLAASLLSSGLVAGGYLLGQEIELSQGASWFLGIGLGISAGLLLSAAGFLIARSIKLRLWDAADMAGRIARGDFSARLPVDKVDEVGLLEEQLNQMAGQLDTAVAELGQMAEQNRRLAEEAGRGAALEERARLARDLHDTVNQQLFVLTMRTAGVRRRLEKLGGEAGALVGELSAVEELARQAHGQARELILQLRPTTLEQQGLGPALAEYVKAAGAREGWDVSLDIDLELRLRGPASENLFRIAQEALNNISKHAGASAVTVGLERSAGQIRLQIRDDGKGFDLKAGVRPTAVGLVGIRERVAALGGKLGVVSAPGKGTELTVSLPEGGGSE